MQEERECERLKYYIFVYNPMNNKCSKDGKVLGLHTRMKHGFKVLGGKITTKRFLHPPILVL